MITTEEAKRIAKIMPRYILNDGTETTRDAILAAHKAGSARLVHSHGLDHTTTCGLYIDGVDRNTRGQCVSMYEEIWTTRPGSASEALQVAEI